MIYIVLQADNNILLGRKKYPKLNLIGLNQKSIVKLTIKTRTYYFSIDSIMHCADSGDTIVFLLFSGDVYLKFIEYEFDNFSGSMYLVRKILDEDGWETNKF